MAWGAQRERESVYVSVCECAVSIAVETVSQRGRQERREKTRRGKKNTPTNTTASRPCLAHDSGLAGKEGRGGIVPNEKTP